MTHYAACLLTIKSDSVDESGVSTIQIFPSGDFSVPHGAAMGTGPWHLNESSANALIAKVAARKNRLVIDYEHQSLYTSKNGQPAPAAGWIDPDTLRWSSEGLFATASWTDKARQMIASGEYRYLSPVFTYAKDGTPTDLINVALTNNPAIDGMHPVLMAASSFYQPLKVEPMIHPAIKALLDIPDDATDDAITEACAALKSKQPDPEQYAPVSSIRALQDELAALRAKDIERDIDDLIRPALDDGRLLPSQESWARDLGKSNIASLRSFLESAPKIPALTGSQTGGRSPDDNDFRSSAFSVPHGYTVDSDRLAVHAKALAYQREHAGTSYIEAVRATT